MLGAETTDCDSPILLINATFQWIEQHLKDSVDFVIWTGDSARHDNDERLPRSKEEVEELNSFMVDKFVQVFGKDGDNSDQAPVPTKHTIVPIIPNLGNNDVLPHNIFDPGPNRWTARYLDIWHRFIPEDQRHAFRHGGWFSVEAIPNRLVVFSLNTLYFYTSNTAVDGCADPSEPGYEQMDWLRIQLQLLRRRGVKAILSGHVPPARTNSKRSWDETCWQKYTLWLLQYRDVIVGSVYGHMNIDHFMLQDSHEISLDAMLGGVDLAEQMAPDDEMDMQSSADYLTELQRKWSQLPQSEELETLLHAVDEEPKEPRISNKKKKKASKKPKGGKRSKPSKFHEQIGGPWAERYSVTLVSPSVVPNYFPTLRVIEYNITDLDVPVPTTVPTTVPSYVENQKALFSTDSERQKQSNINKDKKKYKKGKHPKSKHPSLLTPDPPSKSSPPGPAYSPQTLTWLSYTQYYANLTTINDDFTIPPPPPATADDYDEQRWHKGNHWGKHPPSRQNPDSRVQAFTFDVEYDTKTDKAFALPDLTVKSFLKLAARLGRYRSGDCDRWDRDSPAPMTMTTTTTTTTGAKKEAKKEAKRRRKERRKQAVRTWFAFVRRAFVGSKDEDELRDEFA